MGVISRRIKNIVSRVRSNLGIGFKLMHRKNLRFKKIFKKQLKQHAANIDALSDQDWCDHEHIITVYPRTTIASINPYKVLGCTKCGLEFRENIPRGEALQKRNKSFISGDWYYSISKANFTDIYNPERIRLLTTFQEYIKKYEIEKYVHTPKRFLEIGCGLGHIVKLMQDWGFESYGVDISSWAVNFMKNELGINNAYQYSDLREAKFPDNHFSFIFLSHTIEHLPEPMEILKEIYRILAPGGILILLTPDSDLYTMTYYYREHLYFFNEYTMKYWLKVLNYQLLTLTRNSSDPDSLFVMARK